MNGWTSRSDITRMGGSTTPARSASAAGKEHTLATSGKANSKTSTGQGSRPIEVDKELAIAIALLARLEERVPGVTVETTNVELQGGRLVAVAIINGCVWDENDRLVLAPAEGGDAS